MNNKVKNHTKPYQNLHCLKTSDILNYTSSIKYNIIMKNKFLLLIFFLISFEAFSQWSNNASQNLQVSDLNGDQATPKIAPTTDGGCYIAWFDNRGGSYAMYLQRLNALGVKQFAADGLLISNNPQNSSLVDYDIICDANNNAVLVFTDLRNGGAINPFAYLISPSGNFLWGANGVTLSDSVNSFQAIPRVVATSDGNYIFIWRLGSGPQKIAMQKLNAAGVKQWGSNMQIITSGTNENYDWCDMVPSDNGSMIMMWSGYTGTFISPSNYRIYSQKFSSTGTRVWNATQDTVYSLGRVSGFYEPKVYPDGSNGALYQWQDDRNLTNRSTAYLQRKTSAGSILFPVNGSAVSTLAGNNHFSGSAAVFPNGETVAIFIETDGLQNQFGVYGQRFSTNGTRQWTDNGKVFTALAEQQPSFLWVYTKDTNAVAGFTELQSGATYYEKAFRVGQSSGNFVWPGNIVMASNVASSKSRMQAAINSAGMLMMTWSDNRNDGGGAYAQNVNFDGTLGNTVGIISQTGVAEKFSLQQNYPNPFNPVTKIKFSVGENTNSNTKITIYDVKGSEVTTLVNNNLTKGEYEVLWDASSFTTGIYFYKIESGKFNETKKMMLIK